MQITGIVVSTATTKQIPKKAGGSYEGWELVYKDLTTDEIKSIQRPSQSLTQVPGLRDALAELTPGDKFVCNLEKEGQFYAVKSLNKGELATPLPARKPNTWKGNAPTRDFESKEERIARQRIIVRQSSLANAVEFSNSIKAKDETALFDLAERMYTWVMRDYNVE